MVGQTGRYAGRVRPGEHRLPALIPRGVTEGLDRSRRLTALGWRAKTGLRQGLQQAYRDFLDHQKERSLV